MFKVTKTQAWRATVLGPSLALSVLLYKQQLVRIAALATGALLPMAAWSFYFGRGLERLVDTEAGRRWLKKNGKCAHFKQFSLESLQAWEACRSEVRDYQNLPVRHLTHLAGHDDKAIAKWATEALSSIQRVHQGFIQSAVHNFVKRHQSPEDVSRASVKVYLRTAGSMDCDQEVLEALLFSLLAREDQRAYLKQVLEGLKDRPKGVCVGILKASIEDLIG